MKKALGIDIAKQKFDVALLGTKNKHKVFDNNKKGFYELSKWLVSNDSENVHACMEATGCYGKPLATYLYDKGHIVNVVNPLKIKAYGRSKLLRNKTDKVDAKIIAEFCGQMEDIRPWKPKPAYIEELSDLTKRLDDLNDMKRQERNRLESSSKDIAKFIKSIIKQLDKQTELIQKQIDSLLNKYSDLRDKKELLETIPGIGIKTIPKILFILDNIEDFKNAKEVAAYAGLTPRNFESGSSVHGKTRLTKIGNSKLRRSLYFPAITAMTHNPAIKIFCDRLKKNGKCAMSVIGAAMRKLLHIIYGILKSGKPFDLELAKGNQLNKKFVIKPA